MRKLPQSCSGINDAVVTAINTHSQALFLVAVTFFAVLVRYTLLPVISYDYTAFLLPWYTTLLEEGFAAFGTRFHNYSMLYMYLLYGMSVLGVPALYGVKLISIVGDLVLACYAGKTIFHVTGNRLRGFTGYALVILCPTVVINGAAWGQCDSLYTAGIVASLYYLLQARYAAALFCYAIAFCFKLQALFVFPVYLALALYREFPLHYLFWGFGLYVVIHIPAIFAGARIRFIFWENYRIQLTRHKHDLSANAPSLWVYVSNKSKDLNQAAPYLGLGLVTVGAFLAYTTEAIRKNILTAMCFFAVFVPFVLPRMHERYFFVADVLTIIYACYRPKRFFVPCLVVLSSLVACGGFIGPVTLPQTVNAMFMALPAAVLGVDLWNDWKSGSPA